MEMADMKHVDERTGRIGDMTLCLLVLIPMIILFYAQFRG